MPVYQVQSRLVSVGRDYSVENDRGEVVYTIDGKVRFARTFLVRDASGAPLLHVREKLLAIDPTFIVKKDGVEVARLRRTTTSGAMTDRFEIDAGATKMNASGSFHRGGVTIGSDHGKVGSVSRKPLTAVREVFHVSVVSDEDSALVLALAMAIVECAPFRGEDVSS